MTTDHILNGTADMTCPHCREKDAKIAELTAGLDTEAYFVGVEDGKKQAALEAKPSPQSDIVEKVRSAINLVANEKASEYEHRTIPYIIARGIVLDAARAHLAALEAKQPTTTDRAEAFEWLDNIKGFLSRCKDTEWDESDEYILRVILSWMPVTPDVKADSKKAYQELFDILENIQKPHTNSEMNDIINVVLKWWGK